MSAFVTMFQNHRPSSESGFSLIETAIIAVILSVLIGLGVSSLKVYQQSQEFSVTHDHRDKIVSAINDYVKEYGALPCPAPMRANNPTPVTDPNFGRKVNCTAGGAPTQTYRVTGRAGQRVHIGAVPARDLGLPLSVMTDSWGNLFTYAVTERLTEPGVLDLPEPTDPNLYDPIFVNANGNDFFIVRTLDDDEPDNHYDTIFKYFDQDPAIRNAIRNGSDLILNVTRNQERHVLTLIDYFSQMPAPHLVRNIDDLENCESNNNADYCLTDEEIATALFDVGSLAYNLAAIEIVQNNRTISPPSPMNGGIEAGHMPFVIISHGPSGVGAHNLQGTRPKPCQATGGIAAQDLQNCDFDTASGNTNSVPNAAVFRTQIGLSENAGTAAFFDDVVSFALKSNFAWPPHRWCGPTSLQFRHPDLTWGDCVDIRGQKGDEGPVGDAGSEGLRGPNGGQLNLTNAVCPGVNKVLQGIKPDESLVCVNNIGSGPIPPLSLSTSIVTQMSSNAGDSYRSIVAECPADMIRVGCGGSRHDKAYDTHNEENGGYIGTIIDGARGCKTGVDGGGGGSKAIAFAYCAKIAP